MKGTYRKDRKKSSKKQIDKKKEELLKFRRSGKWRDDDRMTGESDDINRRETIP